MIVSDLTFRNEYCKIPRMNYCESSKHPNLPLTTFVRVAYSASQWFIHPDSFFAVHPRTNTYKINETGVSLQKKPRFGDITILIGSADGARKCLNSPTIASLHTCRSLISPNRLNANSGHSERNRFPKGLFACRTGGVNSVQGGTRNAGQTHDSPLVETSESHLKDSRINTQCQAAAPSHLTAPTRLTPHERTQQNQGLLGGSLHSHPPTPPLFPPPHVRMSVPVILAYPSLFASLTPNPTIGGIPQ